MAKFFEPLYSFNIMWKLVIFQKLRNKGIIMISVERRKLEEYEDTKRGNKWAGRVIDNERWGSS